MNSYDSNLQRKGGGILAKFQKLRSERKLGIGNASALSPEVAGLQRNMAALTSMNQSMLHRKCKNIQIFTD